MNARQRWIVALSPDGAARTVAEKTAEAFREQLAPEACSIFDPRVYREGYKKLLKGQDEEMVVDLLNQSFAVHCFDFGATHCLVGALCPITLFTLNLLRKHGVVTLHWFYEDFRRATYWRDILPGYDHFLAIQRGPLPSACRAASTEFHLLPTAGTAADIAMEKRERCFDIAFIGIPSPYRITVLEALASSGMSVACGGEGWGAYRGILQKNMLATSWISGVESCRHLSRSKIGINLSLNDGADRENTHISPRAYDILAAGALLLTENSPLIAESLAGCTFQTFRSVGEAIETARDLLARSALLEPAIHENGRVVRTRHTYRSRVRDIISLVN